MSKSSMKKLRKHLKVKGIDVRSPEGRRLYQRVKKNFYILKRKSFIEDSP